MQKTKSKPKAVSSSDNAYLLTAPEISIFTAVFAMRNSLLELERNHLGGIIEQSDFFKKFNTILAEFTETAEATHRFDIVLPVMAFGKFSSSFWRWFNWWDQYMESLSNPDRIRLHTLAMDRLPGLESYRPPGHWSGCSPKPAFTVIVV
jgi:hypothetical protein